MLYCYQTSLESLKSTFQLARYNHLNDMANHSLKMTHADLFQTSLLNHKSLNPANKRPAPKKPLKIAKYCDTVNENITPKNTIKPTIICTWRIIGRGSLTFFVLAAYAVSKHSNHHLTNKLLAFKQQLY